MTPNRVSEAYFNQGMPPGDSSIDQPAADRGQEAAVENIRRMGPLVEFEILSDLIDGAFHARGIDAAQAVAFDLAGQDVVRDHGAQPLQLQIARAALHPA